jgi:hypothetical protein
MMGAPSGFIKTRPSLPSLPPLVELERALRRRLDPDKPHRLRAQASARHWLPLVRVSGQASSWDRVSFDDSPQDYRREGASLTVSLEFRLPELVYDSEERALLAEARAARHELFDLTSRLHARFAEAHVLSRMLLDPGVGDEDVDAYTEAVLAARSIAFGTSELSEGAP